MTLTDEDILISIHALRVEGDGDDPIPATRRRGISIHALRVEGDMLKLRFSGMGVISIHALRVEGDRKKVQQMSKFTTISIHALRVEGDVLDHVPSDFMSVFLSTPSGWRATLHKAYKDLQDWDFYPRPPGGGRLHLYSLWAHC